MRSTRATRARVPRGDVTVAPRLDGTSRLQTRGDTGRNRRGTRADAWRELSAGPAIAGLRRPHAGRGRSPGGARGATRFRGRWQSAGRALGDYDAAALDAGHERTSRSSRRVSPRVDEGRRRRGCGRTRRSTRCSRRRCAPVRHFRRRLTGGRVDAPVTVTITDLAGDRRRRGECAGRTCSTAYRGRGRGKGPLRSQRLIDDDANCPLIAAHRRGQPPAWHREFDAGGCPCRDAEWELTGNVSPCTEDDLSGCRAAR